MASILLVDDEENNLSAMRRLLHAEQDFNVEAFTSATAALRRARETGFDVVLADYRMPEMDGTRFLEEFQKLQPNTFRIIASAFSDSDMFRKAINQAQIHRFIQKPWDGFLLVEAIKRGAEQAGMTRELIDLRKRVQELTAMLEQVARQHPDALPANWREQIPVS